MGQIKRQGLSGYEGGRQTLYIVVPYARRTVKGNTRGAWRTGQHVAFPEMPRADRYARGCIGRGDVVGAIVARQAADVDAGDWADPEVVARFGELPDLADPIAAV